MLSDREIVDALIINLKTWNWDVYSKMSIDEKTGKALVKEWEKIKEEKVKNERV